MLDPCVVSEVIGPEIFCILLRFVRGVMSCNAHSDNTTFVQNLRCSGLI